MNLLRFGRAAPKAKAKAPAPAPAPEPASSTRRGVVFLDDNDLTRYQNNYQLYDTGPRSGRAVLDFHAPGPAASSKPVPLWPPHQKHHDPLGSHEPVIMLDASSGRFHDTPIICEEESTFAASDYIERHHESHHQRRHRKGSVNSIDILPIPRGAIRTGGPAKLFGTQYIGLILNWLILGLVDGATQTLVTPLFSQYLHMATFQANAVATLLRIALLVKPVLSFLSDTCPIQSERRKPYIYIGWLLFTLCMLVLVSLPSVEPYLSTDATTVNNVEAPTEGTRYVVPLVIASFGHLCVTVACEGIVVELAQREGEFLRGRTQCIAVTAQLLGHCVGTIAVSLGANNASYGGTFRGAVPVEAIFGLFALLAVVGIVSAWWLIEDEVNIPAAQPVAPQLRRLGQILLRRPTWTLMVFGFACTSALSFEIREAQDVYTTWLDARPLSLNLSRAAESAAAALTTFLVFKVWVNTNWRRLVLASVAFGVVVATPIELVTYFDVWRNLVFYCVKDQLVSLFDAVIRIISLLVIVEVAEPGFEASTYGLVTIAYHVASPFVAVLTNVVSSAANLEKQDLSVDSSDVRRHVSLELVTKVAIRLVLIFAATPLLPRQKSHARDLNTRRSNGRALSLGVCAALVVVYLAVATSSVLSLVESTSCLVFAGGDGCD